MARVAHAGILALGGDGARGVLWSRVVDSRAARHRRAFDFKLAEICRAVAACASSRCRMGGVENDCTLAVQQHCGELGRVCVGQSHSVAVGVGVAAGRANLSVRHQLVVDVMEPAPSAWAITQLRILETVKRLQRSPRIGRVGRREGTRELRARGLPFVIVYRIDIGDRRTRGAGRLSHGAGAIGNAARMVLCLRRAPGWVAQITIDWTNRIN